MSAVTILSDPCVALGTTLRAKPAATSASAPTYKAQSVTIPNHKQLRIGTLVEILGDIANYLDLTREELTRQLFG
jgi:hypothetical protein